MSSYDNRNTGTPSAASIRGMWAITALVAVATASITATGETFDIRHGTGFLLGVLATALIAMQAGNRMVQRDAVLWKAEAEQAVWRGAEIGTWENQVDGSEAYVSWTPERQCYGIGGSLLQGVEPGFVGREEAHSAAMAMERAGYRPADDDGTRAIRERLMLPGWYVGG